MGIITAKKTALMRTITIITTITTTVAKTRALMKTIIVIITITIITAKKTALMRTIIAIITVTITMVRTRRNAMGMIDTTITTTVTITHSLIPLKSCARLWLSDFISSMKITLCSL